MIPERKGDPEVSVRPATLDDSESIADLLTQLGYSATRACIETRLHAITDSNDGEVTVAELRGSVVGVASYHVTPRLADDRPYCRITAFVVDERYRRLRVGSSLVAWIERQAVDTGCDVMEVTSGRRPERDAAREFYKRLGFEDSGRTTARYLKRL